MTLVEGRRRPGRLPATVRWVALAWIFASTADTFVVFTLFWLAEPQGWSGWQTALIVLATRAPTLLGGLAGGWAVDRFGPRRMLGCDAGVRAVLLGGFVVAGLDGSFGLGTVAVLGALTGATGPIAYAAARTLVPRLVPEAQLGRANALLSLGDQLPLLLSAGLIGPAITLLGPGPAFLVPIALLIMVALIAGRIRAPRPAVPRPGADGTPAPTGVAGQSGRSPWREPGVIMLIALSVAYYCAYGPFEPVLPWFVRDQLAGGADSYSLLWIAFGLGALSTIRLAPWLAATRPGLVNALGAVAWGMITLPVMLTGSTTAAVIVFFLSGAVWGPYSAIETTALQRWTDPRRHGRLFGAQRALLQTAAPAGAVLGAIALDHTTPAMIIAVSTTGCALAGLVALTSRDIRRRH